MAYLITGATGSIGGHVVTQLLALGADVHVLTRKPDQAQFPSTVKVFGGDLATGAVQEGAFDGVQSMFVFPASGDMRPFLAHAEAAGIERCVVLSSLAAAGEAPRDLHSPSYHHHRAIEQAVAGSGLAYTFLRPGSFANNLLFWAYTIKNMSMVAGPYPQSAQSLIHEADVADVAVTVLTTDGHAGQQYQLTGPECLTQIEQLNTIGAAIGRGLTYRLVTPAEWSQSMRQFMAEDIITMLLEYWSDTVAQPDLIRPTVTQITGKPGRTLAQWAADHAATFA
jgi:uncharacterized protein YbjT (DUF2867 family)